MGAKEKSLIVLTVMAFGYLGHEVYGLMQQDMSSPVKMAASSRVSARHQRMDNDSIAIANAAENSRSQPLQAASLDAVKPASLPYQPLATGQRAYLHMVNQYELAKMKRRLLEERAAIAAAQHRIATLNKETRQIDDSVSTDDSVYDDSAVSSHHSVSYVLSYVGRQHGEWTATLNRNGHYYEVQAGSLLSEGEKVLAISRRGVTIQAHDERERVTFDGTEVIPTKAPVLKTSAHPIKALKTVLQDKPPADLEGQARRALMAAGMLSTQKMPSTHAKKTILSTQESRLKEKMDSANKLATTIAAEVQKKHSDTIMPTQDSATKKPTVVAPKSINDQLKAASSSIALKKKMLTAKNQADKAHLSKGKRADIKKSPIVFSAVTDTVKVSNVASRHVLKKTIPAKPSSPGSLPSIKKHSLNRTAQKNQATSNRISAAPRHTAMRYSQDEGRLLDLPKNSLTIQLIGSYHPDIVENFAIANDLGNRAIQVYVTNRGKKWYMLFYGDYQTKKAAQAALRDLPPNLTPEHPWVRRLSTLQYKIRQEKHQ